MADGKQDKKPIGKRIVLATSLDVETFTEFEDKAWERRHRTNSEALREAIRDWIVKDVSIDSSATNTTK